MIADITMDIVKEKKIDKEAIQRPSFREIVASSSQWFVLGSQENNVNIKGVE